MIEQCLKSALERITGMNVYPLLLPDTEQEGVTFQRISDPTIETGLVRTSLVEGRFQIKLYVLDKYTQMVELDAAIWAQWKEVVHGDIDGYPVQYVRRAGIQQGVTAQANNSKQYWLSRDFILTFSE
ncbi:hypothetical protein [Yersinia intermedia]|uniref:hypothetical protein n=1 Tax=Yersinia intermedia TaxID=631 RepID=UPI001CFEDCB7|nr:hypothetical protein [Yersinia intermedia]MCB5311909.1 hypothetical protein [Yersinia intermedia]MCB5325366.1 hypothetical protein [Yersinia intermedia]